MRLQRGLDDRLAESAAAAGYARPHWPAPAMAMLPGADHEFLPELEIRRGPDLFEDHADVSAPGFGTPRHYLQALASPSFLDRDDVVIYADYVAGRPVASSMVLFVDGAVNVFNVVTDPDFRQRGYAAAMTIRATIDGFSAGCTAAYLESSQMGVSIYLRLGFETVFEYDQWVSPEPAA